MVNKIFNDYLKESSFQDSIKNLFSNYDFVFDCCKTFYKLKSRSVDRVYPNDLEVIKNCINVDPLFSLKSPRCFLYNKIYKRKI